MKTYRYCLRTADREGVKLHPLDDMHRLGLQVVQAEPVTIADCWIIQVSNDIDNIPPYLIEVENYFPERKIVKPLNRPPRIFHLK